ncbi:MAG: iron ABC transporter permease [Oscillospiraceae bacterium]|nr:iron ABC transporter permease [Oscillospiraceae bacterium]
MKNDASRSATLRRRARYELIFLLLIAAVCVIVVLNINIGSVPIPVPEILRILFTRAGDDTQVGIIWGIRLPRMLMAAILGGGLSLSGFLLQTFFANPIAGPFVLGISSGAKMVVAVAMIYFLGIFRTVSSAVLVVAAFIGAMLSTGFILLISRKLKSMSTLLVAGIMIGYICSAVTDFIVTFADDSDIVNLRGWSLGSFSGMSWENVGTAAIIIGVVSVAVFLMSKPIGAYQMGEHYAQSMGVNIRVFRVALIILSSILSACVTAFAGPISFVGIAVPHLIKRAMNTSKPIVVIPASFLGGAVFCMACDLIARTAFAPTDLNISTVTSVFGAPVVIAMMLRQRKER